MRTLLAVIGGLAVFIFSATALAAEPIPTSLRKKAEGRITLQVDRSRGSFVRFDFTVEPPTIFVESAGEAACRKIFPIKFVKKNESGASEFISAGEGVLSGCERQMTLTFSDKGITGTLLSTAKRMFDIDAAWQ